MLYRIDRDYIPSWDQLMEGDAVYFPYQPAYYAMELTPGTYRLEVWGSGNGWAGVGGYSVGDLTITENTNAFIWTGGWAYYDDTAVPTAVPDTDFGIAWSGGFNGGGPGNGKGYYSNSEGAAGSIGYSGAGATDIRLVGNTLYHRVIVAGGAGGKSTYTNGRDWGYGGGYTTYGRQSNANQLSADGTSGASFGVGGSPYQKTNYKQIAGAGGGGWYGGKANFQNDNTTAGWVSSGGGSGFTFDASRKSQVPTGYKLDDKYLLTNTNSICGNVASIPSYSNPTSLGYGLTGNGQAKITKLPSSLKNQTTAIYVKQNNMWVKFMDLS